MADRVLIAVVLVAAGYGIFRLAQWWSLRRAQHLGTKDPLLASFVPGRPAILYFTSENCVPCRTQQRPALEKLIHRLGEANLQIIRVDADHDIEHARRWGVMTLPTTFVLDTHGQAQAVNYGVASVQKLTDQLAQLSKGS